MSLPQHFRYALAVAFILLTAFRVDKAEGTLGFLEPGSYNFTLGHFEFFKLDNPRTSVFLDPSLRATGAVTIRPSDGKIASFYLDFSAIAPLAFFDCSVCTTPASSSDPVYFNSPAYFVMADSDTGLMFSDTASDNIFIEARNYLPECLPNPSAYCGWLHHSSSFRSIPEPPTWTVLILGLVLIVVSAGMRSWR